MKDLQFVALFFCICHQFIAMHLLLLLLVFIFMMLFQTRPLPSNSSWDVANVCLSVRPSACLSVRWRVCRCWFCANAVLRVQFVSSPKYSLKLIAAISFLSIVVVVVADVVVLGHWSAPYVSTLAVTATPTIWIRHIETMTMTTSRTSMRALRRFTTSFEIVAVVVFVVAIVAAADNDNTWTMTMHQSCFALL